jgi:ubiquinone biosynthesis protein COQ9
MSKAAQDGNQTGSSWADEAEQRVLDEAVRLAPAAGWNARLTERAAQAAGLSPGETQLLLPEGARDLAALLSRRHDAVALEKLTIHDPNAMKMWRWAGDTATDENHYSKRAILSGILVSTMAVDMASGRDSALAHLDARIDNVMAFEKWKAGIKPMDLASELVTALAKMRYGRG